MHDFEYGPRDYDSFFDGPDVKLYRHEAERELRRLVVINQLLSSLTPADGRRDLFTFWERKLYHLQHHQKPPR
ncbi:MAG: hypothetical protein H0W74_14285 [Sphingosinicella sp.]|nr:hypothetical protein [Sphingosinicella sp.]